MLECPNEFCRSIHIHNKYEHMCRNCLTGKIIMSNIKITAEVDGKQVPLETVSTETFEAIKALEKPKEIPVARVGNWPGRPEDRRLFLKISHTVREHIIKHDSKMIAVDLENGSLANSWKEPQQVPSFSDGDPYENIKPL